MVRSIVSGATHPSVMALFHSGDSRFVLCWSHFQGSWDNVGPFHIYGSTGEPWFTARVWYWAEKGTIDLWGYFLTARYVMLSCQFQNTSPIQGWCGLAN